MLFAAAWFMQALACGYYLFYLSVLIGLWLLWFPAGRERWRALSRVVLAGAVAAVLLAPVLYGYWTYQRAYGMRRWPDEIISFSADVASVLKASDNLRLWGWLDVVDHPESALFPGITPILLIIVGLAIGWSRAAKESDRAAADRARARDRRPVLRGRRRVAVVLRSVEDRDRGAAPAVGGRRRTSRCRSRCCSSPSPACCTRRCGPRGASRSALTFYALAAVVMWLFSLGPAPTLMDRPIIYKAPYAWLMMLPGVDGVRVPAQVLDARRAVPVGGRGARDSAARRDGGRGFARALPVLVCLGLLSDAGRCRW